MEDVLFSSIMPLILSFSPWEKGPLNYPQREFWRSLSHGERDRVRGVTPVYDALRCVTP